MTALAITTFVGLIVSASLLPAEELEMLDRGARVRLTTASSAGARLKGTVHSTDATTLTILTDEHQLMKVPRAQVTKLEIAWGRTGRARKGFLIGSLVGLASGLAIASDPSGLCVANPCPSMKTGERIGVAAVVVAMYGGIGAGIGALVKTDRWVDTPLDTVRVSAGPVRGGGVGASVSLRF